MKLSSLIDPLEGDVMMSQEHCENPSRLRQFCVGSLERE